MPRKDRIQELLDPSTEAMLGEHERLSALYLYNAEIGEKRTALYLTLVSVGTAALLGMAQFGVEMVSLLWPSIGLLIGMLVLGVLTFQRLIERRVRAVEYLRAINRIHSYFVQNDPSLEPYFYWPPCDDLPSFGGKGAALAGLRDVIAVLNSLFVGILVAVTGFALRYAAHYATTISLGVVASVIAWLLHRKYESRSLGKSESEAIRYVRFPKDKRVERPVKPGSFTIK